ncbi:Uncharacterized protein M6B38_221335 [Iris pallida]|uniref:U1-type domain-containing protein n=1 Tax=Iris pallida TaxID=29817 RepID=A0AAX6DYV4_IRIPA|nr:Uncharacterized protein M6B38_221335 [Iris pallida]
MESQFRAGDDGRWSSTPPPPLPLSSGDGYFSFQAMQAGFGDAGRMRPRPTLEALEMELREERIKEEILARRIAQRRMVEEQARREMEIAMAMGMGMGMGMGGEGGGGRMWRMQSAEPMPLMLGPPEDVGFGGRREVEFGERRRFGPTRFGRRDLPKVEGGKKLTLLEEVDDTIREVPKLEGPIDVEFGRRDVEFEERGRLGDRLGRRNVGSDGKLPLQEARGLEVGKKLALSSKKPEVRMTSEIIPQKLSGVKRKQVTATSVVSSSKFPRPAQKEWSCALCQVSATSEEGLNEHLQGKKHQAKAAQLAPKKNFAVTTVAKDTVAKDGGDGSGSSASKPKVAAKKKPSAKGTKKVSIKVDGKIHEVVEKGRFLWCWMCRVKCNCQATMIGHLSGKRHLQESNKPKANAEETTQNKEVVKDKKECTEEAEQPGGGSANETGITQNEKVVDVKKEGKEKVEEPAGGGSANEIGTTQNEEVVDVKKNAQRKRSSPAAGVRKWQ